MRITKVKLDQIIQEELSKILSENLDIEAHINGVIEAINISPSMVDLGNLKMKLVDLGFDESDMFFNEWYPASLSFGNPYGELGEWQLPLEGKRVGRLIEN